jgi:hypothetical protein
MSSSQFPCYLVPLRPKYPPQHPILEPSQQPKNMQPLIRPCNQHVCSTLLCIHGRSEILKKKSSVLNMFYSITLRKLRADLKTHISISLPKTSNSIKAYPVFVFIRLRFQFEVTDAHIHTVSYVGAT